MARFYPLGSGGGTGSDECTLVKANVPVGFTAVTADSDDEAVEGTLDPVGTAESSHVLLDKTYVKWNPETNLFERQNGAMPNNGAVSKTLTSGESYTISEGYHDGTGTVTAPTISSQTPGTAAAGDIRTGKTAWVNGTQITGSVATLAGGTKTPGASQQTISCNGKIMTSDIVIPGFSMPAASVIKKGTRVSIYGRSVTGTFEGYVPTASDLYNNGSAPYGFSYNQNLTTPESNMFTFSTLYNKSLMFSTSKTFNLSGYTRFNIDMEITGKHATKPKYLYVNAGTTAYSSAYPSTTTTVPELCTIRIGDESFSSAPRTTYTGTFSGINATKYIVVGMDYLDARVYRIWLS